MFDYLQKFNALPKDLRDKISSPAVMDAISALENKYGVDLAMTVMRIMIKDLQLVSLPLHLSSEFGLNQEQAESLSRDLKERVFLVVSTYLGLKPDSSSFNLSDNLDAIIKDAGINFSSRDLSERFKKILHTYLRGVRTKIDTRDSLAKGVASGGLNFDASTIDRVFKACDQQLQKMPVPAISKPPISPALEKLIKADNASSRPMIAREEDYDLKKLAAAGHLKPLDASHEIEAPDKVLDLPPASKDVKETHNQSALSEKKEEEKTEKQEGEKEEQQTMGQEGGLKDKQENQPEDKKPIAQKPEGSSVGVAVPGRRLASSPSSLRPLSDPHRPRVADIKPMPKIMGPIEELQFLDLTNFRRLGDTPTDIVDKIFNKIRLLEKTSYEQMIAGVVAWRKGIINRLYLKMCQEAFVKGITLKELIAKRQEEKREFLSWEEVMALVSLNKKLMF